MERVTSIIVYCLSAVERRRMKTLFTVYYAETVTLLSRHIMPSCSLTHFLSAQSLLYFTLTYEVLQTCCVLFKSKQEIYVDLYIETSTLIHWRECFGLWYSTQRSNAEQMGAFFWQPRANVRHPKFKGKHGKQQILSKIYEKKLKRS